MICKHLQIIRYLHPDIAHTWRQSQKDILTSVCNQETNAILGMDMCADSMEYSAKYGCCSTLEVTQNKVLHIELVQVTLQPCIRVLWCLVGGKKNS